MSGAKKRILNYWPLLLILGIVSFFFLNTLGKEHFWDWDECLYAQYPKEMQATGNYLINQWNGFADLQKPPLLSWLQLIPHQFGVNEFNIRIATFLFALGLIAAVYIFAKKYFSEKVALLSTLILLASELFVIYARRVNTDIGFAFLIFLGFYAWFLSSKKPWLSYLAGLLFGLSVMIKGFSVVPYLAALFIASFFNFKKERLINYFKMIGVFLVVVIPWHLAAYLAYGKEFIQLYVIDNIVKRTQNPIEFHYGGRLFYAKLIYKELFPWIFFAALFPLYKLVTVILARPGSADSGVPRMTFTMLRRVWHDIKTHELIYTVILLIALPLIAITRIQTKIAWYALPIYPFLAIFLAYNINLLFEKIKLRTLFYLLVFFIAIDGLSLVANETKFNQKLVVSPRNEVALKAKEHSSKTLEYLVAFSERQAEAILPPQQKITQTFVYGGNPCAVFYSGKKVNYFYNLNEFKDRLKGKGLFLLENGDLHLIKNLPVKVILQNKEFTLFER